MSEFPFIPYRSERLPPEEMHNRAQSFFESCDRRRSVREFTDEPVPRELVERAIRAACTAPSGAHRQPWKFVVVGDAAIKREIRDAAEQEEHAFYEGIKTPPEWIEAVRPLNTGWRKPYLETVPWLVVVFEQTHSYYEDGRVRKNYYVKESVGMACGLFVTAIHNMGLATLTHTPNPMGFLSKILDRPDNERPSILFPVGFPDLNATVPDLMRKTLDENTVWFDGDS